MTTGPSPVFSSYTEYVPETESCTIRILGKYFIARGSIVQSFETLLIM